MVWGGKQMITILFLRATSITSRFLTWVTWPSKSNKIGFPFVGCVCLIKWWSYCTNISNCIHPDGWQTTNDPGGASSSKSGFNLTLGNINNGGIYEPDAEKQIVTVTFWPLSADDSLPTCLRPFWEIILALLLATFDNPLSSTLKICSGLKWWVS